MYKALISFSGVVSMAAGEVKDIDPSVAADLLKAGYIEEVKEVKERKKRSPKGV